MKAFIDFFPLLLFFAAYKLYDIYIATVVAIVASLIQVGLFWYRHHRFEVTHLITLAVILVFGGLTLALHDDTFIKWKPTIIYWVFAAILLGSLFIGKKTAIEFVMGSQLQLPQNIWRKVNLSWGAFFVVLGIVNLYVAFYYALDLDEATRRDIWVNFKVFGLLGLTLLFVVGQAVFLAKHMPPQGQEE